MIDELEALVGYVYIVGGRAVSATPPGGLVELPPRKPPRGREQDTFFALITPAGTNTAQAGFYEQLAALAAELYFRSTTSVTNGLREAINGVNSYLIDHSQLAGQRYEANVACLVLRGQEVYMARAGEMYCLLWHGEQFITLPEALAEPYTAQSLGVSPVIDIKLSRLDVGPGDVVALSDAGLKQADRARLEEALTSDSVQGVLDSLKPLGAPHTQSMVVRFSSLANPDPSLSHPTPGVKIMRSSNAPISKTSIVPPKVKTRTDQLAAITPPAPAPVEAAAPVAQPASAPAPTAAEPPAVAFAGPIAPDSADSAPDDSAPQSTATPSADVAAGGTAPAIPARPLFSRAVGGVAGMLEGVGTALNRGLDRMLPEASEQGPRIPSLMAAALAVLVPVIIVFVVVAIRLTQQDTTQFEQLVRSIQEAAAQAETIPLEDAKNARTAWLGVMQRIEDAEAATGRLNDPILVAIKAKAQGILDHFAAITRRTPTLLRSFDAGAQLIGPIVRAGSDLYTLDTTATAIYRDRLNPSSKTVFRRTGEAVVVKGQAVSAFSVQGLIDMEWMADGSVQNSIVALDRQGILVTYSPVFTPAAAKKLPGADLWVTPVAMTVWRERLYVLDPGASQIWRYISIGDAYPNPPEPYFQREQPDLGMAVDMAIDGPGNVYVLFADGSMKKFQAGTEQIFSYSGMPEDGLKSASRMYLDADSSLPAIYVLDPRDQAVYHMTLGGKFLFRLKSAEPGLFRNLSGVFVSVDDVYVAAGSTIYLFSIADLRTVAPGSP